MSALRMREGPLAGQRIVVDTEVVLGRHDADIVIDDPQISRRHAIVRWAQGVLEIEDLGSLNGTWVNDDRLTGIRRLAPGDVIRVGEATMEVELEQTPRGPAPTVVSPAPAAEAPPARHDPGSAEDELRPVTALFADIVGSTALGERLSPAEVKAVVGECVTRMAHTVEQFGGVVQAYMGDGIAAFFGLPIAHEDDPERATRAALHIIEEVSAYSLEVERAWAISNFNARVGLNTGEVAVGLVGAGDPKVVSLGDTANVAARLQSLADPGTIAVGETTARRVVHGFVLDPLGDHAVKGRTRPVEAWRLVCAQTDTLSEAQTTLVGREAELARLRPMLSELADGRGRIVLVIGEAGIGKTRLLAEIRSLAPEGVTWLEGQCRSYGAEPMYGPFVQMLRRWAGVEEGEPDLSVRTKLRAKLDLLSSPPLLALLPSFARFLSLRPLAGEHLSATPEALAAELQHAVRAWIATLAGQAPVVIAIEDLHRADDSTVGLTSVLLELVDTAPVLLIASSTIDPVTEGWRLRVRVLADFAHRAAELQLEPLSDDDARLLLEGLPRGRELTREDLDQIVHVAEGNPLYLEELVNGLLESPRPTTAEPTALTSAGGAGLTPTLESLLLARADRLSPAARRLALHAAVVGRTFPRRTLEHVAGPDIGESLAELIRADVVRELRRYPEPEFVFRHGLLREALLSTLPSARCRALYTAVGTAVEALFAGTLEEHVELLAHYFARSDDPHKALDYLERSGQRAADLAADERAAQFWRRALAVAREIGDAEAVRRLGARVGSTPGGA